MMPHPERMTDKLISTRMGLIFFEFIKLDMKITNKIIEKHGLKLNEYKSIQKLLNRDPNLLELGIFSAMWNEHCSYRILKNTFKVPTKGKQVIQGPGENAGVIDIGDDDAIVFKMKVIITHLILNLTRVQLPV